MPCNVMGTCTQVDPGAGYYGSGFHQNPFASVQSALQDCGAGMTCADVYAYDVQAQLAWQGLQNWQAQIQREQAAAQTAAEKARTCNNPLCGITQGLWQTGTSVLSLLTNPSGLSDPATSQPSEFGNQLLGAATGPWLEGSCEGSCWGGQAAVLVASLLGGEEGDAARGAALLRVGSGSSRLLMNMDTVAAIAQKYGIDLNGLDIALNKAIRGVRGSTAPDQSITLYRGAFDDEESLAKTLVHERFHVGQLQGGMPYPEFYDPNSPWEIAAENHANDWWARINGVG